MNSAKQNRMNFSENTSQQSRSNAVPVFQCAVARNNPITPHHRTQCLDTTHGMKNDVFQSSIGYVTHALGSDSLSDQQSLANTITLIYARKHTTMVSI